MTEQLPGTSRADEDMQGHWLWANLGKRVLRPGGRELTERLLGLAGVPNVDVVELAPGLGRTAASILELGPASYTGVDSDPDAVAAVRRVVGSAAQLVEADAAGDRSGWGVRGPRHRRGPADDARGEDQERHRR